MPELKHLFQTDPEDKTQKDTEPYVDLDDNEYDSISIPKPSPDYSDDDYDY